MERFSWDNEKNSWLIANRDVSFELVVLMIARGEILDIIEHKNPSKYPGQRVFVVNINGYAYCVPFVESETDIVLKTIFPDRRSTKRYLGGG